MTRTNDSHYPPELMAESWQNRAQWFSDYFILEHPLFRETFQSCLDGLRDAESESIHVITGATGTGKTTLIRYLIKTLLEDFEEEPVAGEIPLIAFNAPPLKDSSFDWNPTLKRYYAQLTQAPPEQTYHLLKETAPSGDERRTVSFASYPYVGRSALIDALRERGVRWVIIDEAQHLTQSSGEHVMDIGRKESSLEQRMDFIKDLVKESQTPHVLVGTLQTRWLLNQSGQLNRISETTHFPRYDIREGAEHRDRFRRCLLELCRAMPVEDWEDLDPHWAYFYKHSFGCIGILAEWFQKTFRYSQRIGAETVRFKHFETKASNLQKDENTAREILENEAMEQAQREKTRDVERRLGLLSEDVEPKRGNPNPGVRLPGEDPVGDEIFDPSSQTTNS